MLRQNKSKSPTNFIDLRNSRKKNRSQQLIQDILPPKFRKRWFYSLSVIKRLSKTQISVGVIVLVLLIFIFIKLFIPPYNPVPKSIRQAVNFQVYYPNPDRLPIGYTLDESSFSSGNNAVLYSVSYGGKQKLIFTEQLKPSATELQNFDTSVIPLNTSLETNIGKATIGAARGETLVSLPTTGSTWIIMTGPYATPQNQLKQVLEAF